MLTPEGGGIAMELSERKKQILKAIIGEYVLTAEPVGSKTLAAMPGVS